MIMMHKAMYSRNITKTNFYFGEKKTPPLKLSFKNEKKSF